jgi:hypothetical protein
MEKVVRLVVLHGLATIDGVGHYLHIGRSFWIVLFIA